jgi:hypothetical protein
MFVKKHLFPEAETEIPAGPQEPEKEVSARATACVMGET